MLLFVGIFVVVKFVFKFEFVDVVIVKVYKVFFCIN